MKKLPQDAVLLIVDLQQAVDDPSWGPRNNPDAERNVARLLAAWRALGMPLIHVRHDSVEPNSTYRPGQPGNHFKPEVAPLPGETVLVKHTNSAFIGTDLQRRLHVAGHATLVIVGVSSSNSVNTTARMAGNLGYTTYLVADGTWTFDKRDRNGRLWSAEDVHALALADLDGEYCTVVDAADVLAALEDEGEDPWLERWLPLLAERSGGTPVLELGCGRGRDSAVLAAAGLQVTGVDLSDTAVASAQARVPAGRFFCQDIRGPLPLAEAGAIVASLSMHYFPWPETLDLAAHVRRHLRPGGALFCRLNSTGDQHFGALGHPQIDTGYYQVDGVPKRFFTRQAVLDLFADGWKILSLEELTIGRYRLPKVVWEVVAERVD